MDNKTHLITVCTECADCWVIIEDCSECFDYKPDCPFRHEMEATVVDGEDILDDL